MARYRVKLSAFTRWEYEKEFFAPDQSSAEDIANEIADSLDGTEYTEDNEYWEEGPMIVEKID